MGFVKINYTVEQQSAEAAKEVASNAVKNVIKALDDLDRIATQAGGVSILRDALGEDEQSLVTFVTTSKSYIKANSDLTDSDLTQLNEQTGE